MYTVHIHNRLAKELQKWRTKGYILSVTMTVVLAFIVTISLEKKIFLYIVLNFEIFSNCLFFCYLGSLFSTSYDHIGAPELP